MNACKKRIGPRLEEKRKADVIYMGIENAAKKAVNTLEERRAKLSQEQRIIEVQPAVYSGGSLYKESN